MLVALGAFAALGATVLFLSADQLAHPVPLVLCYLLQVTWLDFHVT